MPQTHSRRRKRRRSWPRTVLLLVFVYPLGKKKVEKNVAILKERRTQQK